MAKTRNSTKSTIAEYLGSPGKDFNPSELPTLRGVLLKGVLLKERYIMEQGGGGKGKGGPQRCT